MDSDFRRGKRVMKYRFEVIYQPEHFKKACDFLKNCDLDIGEVGIRESYKFTSEKDLSIETVKENFKKAFESCGCKVLQIEGGKIE